MRLPVRESMLSEFARAKFAKHGRGAVVIDEGGSVQTVGGEKSGTVLAYLYPGSVLLEQVGGKWPGDTGIAVETYDPSTEMVVFVLDRAGEFEAYLLPLTDDDSLVH